MRGYYKSYSVFLFFFSEQKWTDAEGEGGMRERKRSVREDEDETMSLTGIARTRALGECIPPPRPNTFSILKVSDDKKNLLKKFLI